MIKKKQNNKYKIKRNSEKLKSLVKSQKNLPGGTMLLSKNPEILLNACQHILKRRKAV